MSDEMPTWLPSAGAAAVGQAREQGRDPLGLEEVDQPHQHRLGLDGRAGAEERGDRVHDHHAGLELVDQLVEAGQVRFQAVGAGAGGVETQQAFLRPGRQIQADGAHVADELALGLLEGEVQAALAAPAGRVDEVGGQARLAGARGSGDEHAAAAVDPLAAEHGVEPVDAGGDPLVDASWCRPSEVIGRTEMPFSSIRKGYSLVPWAVPRYLTMRSLRVESCSVTRWSRTMTQSETYSSRPWRVSVPSPRSPVMIAVTPLSLSQRNRRRSSARRTAAFDRPPKSVSMVSSTTRLAPMRVDGVAQADEEAFEVVLAGLLDLAPLDVDEVHQQLVLLGQILQVEPEGADVLGELLGGLLEGSRTTPGSPNSVAPRTRNSIASSVLPQPAPPQTSVGRPRGSPPPVISSSPWMPVAALGSERFFGLWVIAALLIRSSERRVGSRPVRQGATLGLGQDPPHTTYFGRSCQWVAVRVPPGTRCSDL